MSIPLIPGVSNSFKKSSKVFCDEKLSEIKEHHCKQIESLNSDYYGFRGEISHFACFRKEVYNKTQIAGAGGYDNLLVAVYCIPTL